MPYRRKNNTIKYIHYIYKKGVRENTYEEYIGELNVYTHITGYVHSRALAGKYFLYVSTPHD